jgi:hypothetical protein
MARLGKSSAVSAFIALLLAFQALSVAQTCSTNPGVTVRPFNVDEKPDNKRVEIERDN